MAYTDYKEMLTTARSHFIDGDYKTAENILQQIILINNRIPEVFHMLGTIYYDKSQFSKSIKHFKRALEIDPAYTDASIGLSIILNDLGKYEDGKKVFEEAQAILANRNSKQRDPFIDGRLAEKHLELASMYEQFIRYDEALDQYFKAHLLAPSPETKMKIISIYEKKGMTDKAEQELRSLVKEAPDYLTAYIKLGVIYYQQSRFADATGQWEKVLFRDPDNEDAKKYLRIAQQSQHTYL